MLNLKINCESAQIEKGTMTLKVNGKPLEEIIIANLPEQMEVYEKYTACVQVRISILEPNTKVEANYEIAAKEDNSEKEGGNENGGDSYQDECL